MTGLFDHLIDSNGNITDVNGNIAAVVVYPRGFSTNVCIGKIFPVLGSNKNSGVFVHTGVGYLLHRMKIETNEQVIPQIELDYKKGYDRLTTGVNVHQFIGYNFMSNSGGYHFYGGFYAQEGFTKNRRTINFDEPVDVVRFEGWSSFRRRVTSQISRIGRSPQRTSNGLPVMEIDL